MGELVLFYHLYNSENSNGLLFSFYRFHNTCENESSRFSIPFLMEDHPSHHAQE